jgi:hypothetical protein
MLNKLHCQTGPPTCPCPPNGRASESLMDGPEAAWQEIKLVQLSGCVSCAVSSRAGPLIKKLYGKACGGDTTHVNWIHLV